MDIKSIIKAHGYTIERIAAEWEIKNGKPITRGALSQSINKNPTVETLQKIANVIGCSVGDFFCRRASKYDCLPQLWSQAGIKESRMILLTLKH